VPEERSVWEVRVGIYATREQAEDVLSRIQRLLCPDPDHRSPCPVPWMTWLTAADGEYPGLVEQYRLSHQAEQP
jgi:hypothetical protein